MDDLASKVEGALGSRPESFIVKTGDGQMAFPSKEEYDYDRQTGNQSPELLAKRTEARRIREEASAAIEKGPTRDEHC